VQSFDATIREAPRGGAYVEVPPDVLAALGSKGRIAVNATFDGIPYRGSIASMGGEKILGLLKSIRSTLGKAPGDQVAVTVELDEAERSIAVPSDLEEALVAAALTEGFGSLSYSHRREYVSWIDEAKLPETRARRVRQTIERLQAAADINA
jgi:hypothetical protein